MCCNGVLGGLPKIVYVAMNQLNFTFSGKRVLVKISFGV